MKAKEYYEKYNHLIPVLPDVAKLEEVLLSIFHDFEKEQTEIIAKRHAQRDDAAVAIIREQNQKWNALVRIFEENHEGRSPIKRDGFKHVWERRVPALKGRL